MQTALFSKKQRFERGFGAGLGAGIIATLIMLFLSLVMGSISLPEALGSSIAQSMPPQLFEYLHSVFGGDAKHYLFYIILVGQCLVFALSGGLCDLLIGSTSFSKRGRNAQEQLHWSVGILLALLLWLFTGLIFLPLTGVGIFGSQLMSGTTNTMLTLAVIGLVFGLFFVFCQNWLVLRQLRKQASPEASHLAEEQVLKRRGLLRNGLIVLGLGTLGVVAWRFITGNGSNASVLTQSQQTGLEQQYKNKILPPPEPNYGNFQPVTGLSSEITSNGDYYQVSKNLVSDPNVDGSSWKLTVDGLVSAPYTLTYKDLMALPMKQQYESMMCISNDVGGQYMSNAGWEGVPLVNLLNRAGTIKPGATKIVLHAADGYADSIHLSKALEPTTLLAVRMNGVPLPQNHGYPARLLVPGIYGMKHVKWLTHIEVVNTDYQGYWQQSGWSDPAPIRMTSRIDTPAPMSQVSAGQPTYIAGVAFSGNKGISEVNVSFDAGKTWKIAVLKRPFSALTWVLWELPWQPTAGTYNIVVRAIDLLGNVQDPTQAAPAPDGSSGYHSIQVSVV